MVSMLAACESSHEVYGEDTPAATDAGHELDAADGELSAGDENQNEFEASPSIIDCQGSADVVSVSGELRHHQEVPSGARLWIVWMADADNPAMPVCFGEVIPAEFPAAFEVRNVPRASSWDLQALLNLAGFFPPMPSAGDYLTTVRNEELNGLVDDLSGIVIDLEPWTP